MTINQICTKCNCLAPVRMITFNDGKNYPICNECENELLLKFKKE